MGMKFPSLYKVLASMCGSFGIFQARGFGIFAFTVLYVLQLELVKKFIFIIQEKRVCLEVKDRMVWEKFKDDRFLVKSLYSVLEGLCATSFPRKFIWIPCAPSKVSLYAWESCLDKVMTLDQLKRRGKHLAIDASFNVEHNSYSLF